MFSCFVQNFGLLSLLLAYAALLRAHLDGEALASLTGCCPRCETNVHLLISLKAFEKLTQQMQYTVGLSKLSSRKLKLNFARGCDHRFSADCDLTRRRSA